MLVRGTQSDLRLDPKLEHQSFDAHAHQRRVFFFIHCGQEKLQMPEEDPQRKGRMVFQIQISIDHGMLETADELLALGAENTSCEKVLAASATLILATALEQGIMNRLNYIAQLSADIDGVDIHDTPYGWLVNEEKDLKARRRMIELPKAVSANKYQLDPNSPLVRSLHELISRRNDLLHIRDEVHVLKESPGRVEVEVDPTTQRHTETIPADLLRIPGDPWGSITLKQAREFREAVGVYFEEVLDREPFDALSPGKIIIESPQ